MKNPRFSLVLLLILISASLLFVAAGSGLRYSYYPAFSGSPRVYRYDRLLNRSEFSSYKSNEWVKID